MTVKIDIKGPIISNDDVWIYEWWEMDATSPRKVMDELNKANGEDVIISINSPGGYVDEGSEIYTALKNYSGNVETQIVGLAASAASVIAMAGDKVRISPTAQIMIHNSSMWNFGDNKSMEKANKMLKTTDKSIVNAYVIKTGKSEEELLEMMAEETWMGAQEALDNKFVDDIMFMESPIKLTASSTVSAMIPQKIIDGFRNGKVNPNKSDGITKEDLKTSLANMKAEILNELKSSEPKKEPEQAPAAKRNLSKLFLNF